jgi:hypothetical protein
MRVRTRALPAKADAFDSQQYGSGHRIRHFAMAIVWSFDYRDRGDMMNLSEYMKFAVVCGER